jgi:hypothetical protein
MPDMKHGSRRFSALLFLCVVFIFPSISGGAGQVVDNPNTQMLKVLYEEAFEISSQVTMDYVKNEFHVDLDGRAANKEEHVVFLCYGCPEGMRFIIQVTYFQPVGHDVVVKYADETKLIRCTVKDKNLMVNESSYTDEEMSQLLKTLIKRVEEENALLRLNSVKK